MRNLLILGAGGHGRVVAEAAELSGKWDRISFLDDREDIKKIYDFSIVGQVSDYSKLSTKYGHAFVAIGNNEKRLELIDKLLKVGFEVPIIIHPKAIVSKYSLVELGTVILAGAVVNSNTTIGRGGIININSTVDHDCEIQCGVHVSSGAVVRSMVEIGNFSTIGARACIRSATVLEEKSYVEDGIII